MRFWVLLAATMLCAGAEEKVWTTTGYEAFRQGSFDSGGANLYVSQKGAVETIHRFDVNNDGYPDLIFNNTHDLVYTVPAYAYSFHAAKRQQDSLKQFAGAGAVRVLASDLNGDGYPELIVARGFDNVTRVTNSWIYWGRSPNSGGGWSERFHTELFTPYVQDVCVADLNRDGHPDLLFVASSAVGVNTSYVYWGAASGFSEHRSVSFETPAATGCLTADLNGDANPDVIVTASGDAGKVFWGSTSGPDFGHPEQLPVTGATAAAAFGQTIYLSTAHGVEIFAVGGRRFNRQQDLAVSAGGRIAAADLNRDGVPDVVVTRANSGRKWGTSSQIFWGSKENAGPRYAAERSTALPTLGAMDVATGDVDGDGWPDIVFANSRSDLSFDVDSYVYWGGADGFDPARRTALATHGAVAVGLASGSVLFANGTAGRPIGDIDSFIYFGSDGGRYSPERMQRVPTVGGYESCIADLNDDGYTDVVLVSSHEGDLGGDTGSFIYWGSKNGLSVERRSTLATHGAIGCAIGDIDRDGWLDIVFSNMDEGGVQIFFGGTDSFAHARERSWPVAEPRFPMLADVDRDGYLDLLVPSLSQGLVIFHGTSAGIGPEKMESLDGMYPVSEQVADLNGDGYPDIIVCNLMDGTHGRYQGVHAQIYWGSADGYSAMRRSELPSSGAHHAVVADFNRDGRLDIFISNYQSEFTRTLRSSIYWGNGEANYSAAHRTELPNESAAGVVAADLNGDGWTDLAVSNHVQNGDHHTHSLIYWNHSGTFDAARTTSLPTIGPHMMTGVDAGNIMTRKLEEVYTSAPYDAKAALRARELRWAGTTAFDSRLEFDVRGADSMAELTTAKWQANGNPIQAGSHRWWQYRAHFLGGRAAWPVLTRVELKFDRVP